MGEKTLVNGANKVNGVLDSNGTDSSEVLTKGLNDATKHINHGIPLHKVKRKLETFQTSVALEVQKKMERMVEEIIQEMRFYELNASQFKDFAVHQNDNIWKNRIETKTDDKTKGRQLPEKVFIPRQSYLTSLLEVNHMRCIYHIFFVIFSVILMNLLTHDLVAYGRINFGLETIQISLGKFHIAMGLWACMQAIAFGLYFAFSLWARVGFMLRKSETSYRLWNYACVAAFVAFQLYFGYIFPVLCVRFDLALISSSVVLLEMTRFMMKMHAFVRTNAPYALVVNAKVEDDAADKSCVRIPPFSKYLFFLFAPVLIYRDSYPRTKHINWRFVGKNLLEVIAVMFFISFIHERYLRPYLGNFGKEKITLGQLMATLFGLMAPGLLIFLAGFYCILHAWQNFTAELLRFADRMFYKDWWTACNYQTYYRDWNILVHDWLYEYIYKDVYTYVFKGSKAASGISVFLASVFVHEYLISYALRFVYPVMLFLFGTSSLFVLRLIGKNRAAIGNFFLWWTLAVGNGLLVSFYTMEYYARQNCPVGDSWKDYVIPVSWWCNGITVAS